MAKHQVEHEYKVGDVVWAKMKGFPMWPGRIDPPETSPQPLKKGAYNVFFFYSRNYSAVMPEDLKPFQEFKEIYSKPVVKKAVAEAETYAAVDKFEESREKSMTHDDETAEAEFGALVSPNLTPSSVTKVVKRKVTSSEGDAHSPLPPKKRIKIRAVVESPAKTPESTKPKKKIETAASSQTPKKATPAKKVEKSKSSPSSLRKSDPAKKSTSNGRIPSQKKQSVGSAASTPAVPLPRPASPTTNLFTEEYVVCKDIKPTTERIGFIGLGIMGSGIVANLMKSGHKLTVWNRTKDNCREFEVNGAKVADSPADVVVESDIIFTCVSDPDAVKDLVFGSGGILTAMNSQKSYVEMTGIDPDTSKDIADAVTIKGARYLEAQIQGSKSEARQGELVILAAGDKNLFEDCQPCFASIGRTSFFLGEIGLASRMRLILQTISGGFLAVLAESLALGERLGISQKEIMRLVETTSLNSDFVREKGQKIIDANFPTNEPLSHLQKDIKLAIAMSDKIDQPLHLAAAANEVFKHAKTLGYGEHDAAAVYLRSRF